MPIISILQKRFPGLRFGYWDGVISYDAYATDEQVKLIELVVKTNHCDYALERMVF